MSSEELQRARRAQPFVPFTLELADGQRLHIPHPEFLAHAPPTRTFSIVLPDGTHKVIDIFHVVALDFANGQRRGGGNGRGRRRRT